MARVAFPSLLSTCIGLALWPASSVRPYPTEDEHKTGFEDVSGEAGDSSSAAVKAMKWIFQDNHTSPVSAMLDVMETADDNANRAAKDWSKKNHDAQKKAQRIMIASTYKAQNGLMHDAVNVNAAIDGKFAAERAQLHNFVLDQGVRQRIREEHERTGDAAETIKGKQLQFQRVQFTSVAGGQAKWDKTGVVTSFKESTIPADDGYLYTVKGDDGVSYEVAQSQLRVMRSVLRVNAHQDPIPPTSDLFKAEIAKVQELHNVAPAA